MSEEILNETEEETSAWAHAQEVEFEEGQAPEVEVATTEGGDEEEPSTVEASKGEEAEKPKDEPKEEDVASNLRKALDDERSRRKEESRQLRELREQVQSILPMKQQIEEFHRQQQGRQAEEEFNNDPIGTLRRNLEDQRKQFDQMTNQQQEAVRHQQLTQQFQSALGQQIEEFKAQTPDYNDAYQHLRAQVAAYHKDIGVPPHEIEARMQQWELHTAAQAMQQGRNPGEVAYSLARRFGYNPQQGTTQEAEKLEKIGQGQESNKTLSGGRSPANKSKLTYRDDMSNNEFDEFWASLERQAGTRF